MSYTLRERTEQEEYERLSPLAAKSKEGIRERDEDDCPFRTKYQRDRDRILHSKPFRRLMRKTQVYIAPEGDHYRTRLTHSLEVSQICRTIGRGLHLNEDLIEAIALGHDVGHTPFGHVGEEALAGLIGHFEHNEQSVRIFQVLTNQGRGLNLTRQVLDGILNHTGPDTPQTLEGQIVKIGDRIAYLCHDYDDALQAGLLKPDDLPEVVQKRIGLVPSKMISAMVEDMIFASRKEAFIRQSSQMHNVMQEFRQFMFERIYMGDALNEERRKGELIINILFEHYMKEPQLMPASCIEYTGGDLERAAADHISGLTDNYAINTFKKLFVPHV